MLQSHMSLRSNYNSIMASNQGGLIRGSHLLAPPGLGASINSINSIQLGGLNSIAGLNNVSGLTSVDLRQFNYQSPNLANDPFTRNNNLFDKSINSVSSIMLGVPHHDAMHKASVDTTALSVSPGNVNLAEGDFDQNFKSPSNQNVKASGFLDSSQRLSKFASRLKEANNAQRQ